MGTIADKKKKKNQIPRMVRSCCIFVLSGVASGNRRNIKTGDDDDDDDDRSLSLINLSGIERTTQPRNILFIHALLHRPPPSRYKGRLFDFGDPQNINFPSASTRSQISCSPNSFLLILFPSSFSFPELIYFRLSFPTPPPPRISDSHL